MWEVVKTGRVGAHMSRADKLADASLTDNFKAYELNQTSQREACNNLASLYCVRHLDDKDIARGRGLIDTIRSTRKGNSRLLKFRAVEIRTLGLTPEKIAPPDQARTAALCASAI